MKANQKFVQSEEAVSPVIGVILMVAITVVLAAVVFVLVSNLSEGGDQAPTMGLQKDESADRLNLISADAGLTWAEFNVIADDAARYDLNGNANDTDPLLVAGTGAAIGTTEAISAGDYIEFCGSAGALTSVNLRIVHIETNTQVYEATLATLADCPA